MYAIPSSDASPMNNDIPRIPNLNPLAKPDPHEDHTYGLPPDRWWLWFRRDLLKNHNIYRMNDNQWRWALTLGVHRKMRPHAAAKEVASIRRPDIG